MFEKDAEKIANEKLCATAMCYNHCNFNSPKHHRCGEWHRCYEIAKGSAEFGYNKANEWHYVKDGDLPEDNKIVLFYTTYFDFWVGGIEPKNDKKHRWEVLPSVSGDYYAEDEVIAWKEIVLPKESE